MTRLFLASHEGRQRHGYAWMGGQGSGRPRGGEGFYKYPDAYGYPVHAYVNGSMMMAQAKRERKHDFSAPGPVPVPSLLPTLSRAIWSCWLAGRPEQATPRTREECLSSSRCPCLPACLPTASERWDFLFPRGPPAVRHPDQTVADTCSQK